MLIATGATPRVLADAQPDGERILTWRQLYDLAELPEHLIVVGSGVTGAEFVLGLPRAGREVTLVSSRDRVLPHEDADAAAVLEDVFAERGVHILAKARAESVTPRRTTAWSSRSPTAARSTGSHALMTVGSVPNTADLGLGEGRHRAPTAAATSPSTGCRAPSVPGIYAAGDCTGVLLLASVAAMQGRIAMWHALGEGVAPIKLKTVAAAVFTRPEIATVGVSQRAIDAGEVPARTIMLPLDDQRAGQDAGPAARLRQALLPPGHRRGHRRRGGRADRQRADPADRDGRAERAHRRADLAHTFSVYPSLSGSITEAGRQLMRHGDLD